MKVLILHQHYHTPLKGGPLRSYYLAQALADFGFEPVVITAHQGSYRVEKLRGVEVHYLSVPYDNSYTFYKRGFAFLAFALKAFRLARKFRAAKICYAISVPLTVGLTAMWIKRRYRIPFVFEVGDLWPDVPVQMGYIRNRVFKKAMFNLERRIYQEARSVVALSIPIKLAIEKKAATAKVHVISNMADTDFFRPSPKDAILEEKFNVKRKFVISYTGAFGAANGLQHLLACAEQSQASALAVQFIICGDGAMKPFVISKIKELGLKNITVLPFAKRDDIREILNVSDAVFVCYETFPILGTGSPHKYFDGLAAGKLIIVNFSGWIRDEIEKYQCGFYCDPRIDHDFTNLLTPFLDDPLLTKKYQSSARQLAEQNYTRRELSKKFVDIIRSGH